MKSEKEIREEIEQCKQQFEEADEEFDRVVCESSMETLYWVLEE